MMKAFEISRYVKKWLPVIFLVSILMTAASYLFFSSIQSYTASTVIRYEFDEAETGVTPGGDEFDINEIKSSAIMSKVAENLQLDPSDYPIDALISAIGITEVVDPDEQTRKDALLDLGQEYTAKPVTYVITFTAEKGGDPDFARSVLDEIMDVYFTYFGEKYVNKIMLTNSLYGIKDGGYDFSEVMDLIDQNVTSNIDSLNASAYSDVYFRSSTSGKTFKNIADELTYIKNVKINDLRSRIYRNQITRNKKVLIANYQEKIRDAYADMEKSEKRLADIEELIRAYVEKMRNSGNTNIDYNYILDNVYEKDLYDRDGSKITYTDQTVTYDKLIYAWAEEHDNIDRNRVNCRKYQDIIDVFDSCTGSCERNYYGEADEEGWQPYTTACKDADKTCSELSDKGYQKEYDQVVSEIDQLFEEIFAVYKDAEITNKDYNDYLGAKNISTISSVAVEESLNVKLYTALAGTFFIIFCCSIAILVGRLMDIVGYAFYTDRITELYNRTAFDSFLDKNQKKLLADHTMLLVMSVKNQREINRISGREAGDQLLKYMAQSIRQLFEEQKNAFLVYNGNAQFIVYAEEMPEDHCESLTQRLKLMINAQNVVDKTSVEYELGYAETQKDDARKLHKLLSLAMQNKTTFRTGDSQEIL